jgi:DNA-binding NarL/FixJ family response regulator
VAVVLLQRDAEMAALDRQLGAVRGGAGRVIAVTGPAGIGKSSLLTAVARSAAAEGITVLRAWGSPLEQDAGWGIARQLFAGVRGDPLWPALAVGAAALARRALDAEADEPAAGGDAMHAAAHGLTWLACGLAERAPTLLIVDDVHWADAPSLRWLVQLSRQLAEWRMGVLCAVRAGEPPAEPELLAELLAAAPEAPVRPRPLEPAAVCSIVTERLPTAGPAFARACHAATAGNPFLLGALLGHLAADGVEPSDEVAARLSAYGPEQVARSVDRQLSRLPAGSADLARAFAVLGRDTPLRQARDLAGLPPAVASRLADRLGEAGLLESDGDRWALVHPLVSGALYEALAPGERAGWHARAARLLAAERTDPEAVALHLLRTEPARDGATVEALRVAAARATQRGAPQSAAAFLRRAMAEPSPDRAVEAEVARDLGVVLAAQVHPDAPRFLVEAVDLATTAAQRARIALTGGRALGLAGYFDGAIALCRRGLEQPAGDAPEVQLRLETELVCDAWLRESGVAEARARTVAHEGHPSPLWMLNHAHRVIADGEPVAAARALLMTVLASGAIAAESDSVQCTQANFLLIACDELDRVRELCGALIDQARPRGWLIALSHGSFIRSIALLRAGLIDDAEADARLSFDLKVVSSPPEALVWALFPLVDALTERGEPDSAEAALASAAAAGAAPAGTLPTAMLLEARGRLRLSQQRAADAYAELRAAADTWQALGVQHPGLATWRVDACRALVALDLVDLARAIAREHVQRADRLGLPGPRGAGLRALAATAKGDEAITLLDEAVRLLAGSPARLEYARALVDLGAALRRANRRSAARIPLSRALALADHGGMRLLAARARDELRATGARPRRSAVSGVEALTAAERRVAALAARGCSNPEIAQQLYVSRRTVETHLTHVFQKLGVGARADLVTRLNPPGGDRRPQRQAR